MGEARAPRTEEVSFFAKVTSSLLITSDAIDANNESERWHLEDTVSSYVKAPQGDKH